MDSDENTFYAEFEFTKKFLREQYAHPVTTYQKISKIVRILSVILFFLASALYGYYAVYAIKNGLSYYIYLAFMLIFFAYSVYCLFGVRITSNNDYRSIKIHQTQEKWFISYDFDENITATNGNIFETYYYNQFGKISENKDYFYLWLSKTDVLTIPKNAFIKGDVNSFRSFFESKIGSLRKGVVHKNIFFSIAYIIVLSVIMITSILSIFNSNYDTPEEACEAYYETKSENLDFISKLETDDSAFIFSANKSENKIYITILEKKSNNYKVTQECWYTVNKWAEMNSDKNPDSIVFNEDGFLQLSKESKQQVFMACLPEYYPVQYLDMNNAVVEEFECNNSKYILYAFVKDN